MNILQIFILFLIPVLTIGTGVVLSYKSYEFYLPVFFLLALLLTGMYGFYPYENKTISVEIIQDKIYDKYIMIDKEKGQLRFTKIGIDKNVSTAIDVVSNVEISMPHTTNKKKPTLIYQQKTSLAGMIFDVDEVTLEIPKEK